MDIDFDKSLPNVDNMKLSSQFYNFNHTSISNFDEDILSDSDSEYLSASESSDKFDYTPNVNESQEQNTPLNFQIKRSAPIPINNENNISMRRDYVYVTNDMVKGNNMFNSIKPDYVLVPRNSPECNLNEQPMSHSPRLQSVLDTSLTILKASYEYISNKSI